MLNIVVNMYVNTFFSIYYIKILKDAIDMVDFHRAIEGSTYHSKSCDAVGVAHV